jgi:DNA-directed RNA polymerase subunit beta'
VYFEDIVKGVTYKEEIEPKTGIKRRIIIEHKGEHHPQIILKDKAGVKLGVYALPEKAYLEVHEGDVVKIGSLLAKTPREVLGTQDITGGLPRVTELFEARRPQDEAIMAEIDGIIDIGEKKRGKQTIVVRNPETKLEKEHLIPIGRHLRVHTGDRVKTGDTLTDGPLVLHDILRIKGVEALRDYLLNEVLGVYRAQGVNINDKHIEIIISQMLRKVKIQSAGDTNMLPGSIVDKIVFRKENKRVSERNGKPATAVPTLIAITKIALQSDSFISAASFQETTRVLAEAAIEGRKDKLVGLKENVILGRLIPSGTGFTKYVNMRLRKLQTEELISESVDKT